MIEVHDDNPIFKLAADFVNYTSSSVFLTGKAGSGKTTFLRHIVATTKKKCVVVAPTGVAAINAGGVTMHSFFQLPFGPFLPGRQTQFNGVDTTSRDTLFNNIRFGRQKIDLLHALELLIIDEVSMVRSDLLDAVDLILRHFRKKPNKPFGGVQMLFIGDLFQLPPVIKTEEWAILKEYYESPFFFHAQALREKAPLYIELKKIYRQTDQHFIALLNRVRNNTATADDLQVLNNRYNPSYAPPESDQYVTLCTHNHRADSINQQALARLTGTPFRFRGTVEGEFSDKALPADIELQLKAGAQVIFIKNDSDAQRRYYNGKLAIVAAIDDENITVRFDSGEEIEIDRETWHNVRYDFNRDTGTVEEEQIGSFKQFPIRLAWAITIHKSQGLTFQHAIIDAGASFAPGQVYVALSRCSSLEGMILYSRITTTSISTDERVLAFAAREEEEIRLQERLQIERQHFWMEEMVRTFDFSRLSRAVSEFREELDGKKLPDPRSAYELADRLSAGVIAKQTVAEKFIPELTQLMLRAGVDGDGALRDRVVKAITYFSDFVNTELLTAVEVHRESLSKSRKSKKYTRLLAVLEFSIRTRLEELQNARFGDVEFIVQKVPARAIPQSSKRGEKGSTVRETLALFRMGKSVDEIARIRSLASGTIESHLAMMVKSGDLGILELMDQKKLDEILKAAEGLEANSLSAVKGKLGAGYSYGEIRAAMNSR